MAFNIEKIGRPLAIIDGGKLKHKYVSIAKDDEEDDISKPLREIQLPDESKFQQVPDPDKEREILYITGPSGSGKSTYTRNYVQQYKKKYRDNDVYVFSALKDDEALDKLKPKRVKIDDTLVTDPLYAEDFTDSLVIFDDIDVISDKKHREAVFKILNQILEVGRHHRVFCVVTNHLPTGGNDTRRILNEAHSITYFPHSGSARQVNYLLINYVGLDKDDIKRLKKSKSRWATIYKNYPQVAMTERLMFKIGDDDDSD
jgi:nicotinamide riboside kinase